MVELLHATIILSTNMKFHSFGWRGPLEFSSPGSSPSNLLNIKLYILP